jgi:hypothetical protein
MRTVAFALCATGACAAPACADDQSADFAKNISNPIASLISAPFQFNYDCSYGPDEGDRVTPNTPLNLTLDHISRLGSHPVSVQGAVGDYAATPDETASWGARLTTSFLFPG